MNNGLELISKRRKGSAMARSDCPVFVPWTTATSNRSTTGYGRGASTAITGHPVRGRVVVGDLKHEHNHRHRHLALIYPKPAEYDAACRHTLWPAR